MDQTTSNNTAAFSASDQEEGGFPATVQLAQGAGAIGTVTNAAGGVTVLRATGEEVALTAGDEIFQGDLVKTDGGGSVGIRFIDDSTMSLSANSAVEMDELVFDPGAQSGSGVLNVFQGVLTFVSGEIAKTDPDAMTLTTPVATIGIRGTTVAIQVEGGAELPDGSSPGQAGGDRLGTLPLPELAQAQGGAPGKTDVVLLADADGNVGEARVATDGGETTLNQANTGSSIFSRTQTPEQQTFSADFVSNTFGGALNANPGSATYSPPAGSTTQDGGDEGDPNAEGEGDPNAEGEGDPNAEGEGDPNAEGEGDPNAEGEGDPNAEGEGDPNAEGEGDPIAEGEGDPNGEGEGDPNADGQGDPNGEGEGDPNADGQGGPNGEGDGDPNAEGEGDPNAEGQDGPNGDGEGEPNAEGNGGPNPDGEQPGDGGPAGDGAAEQGGPGNGDQPGEQGQPDGQGGEDGADQTDDSPAGTGDGGDPDAGDGRAAAGVAAAQQGETGGAGESNAPSGDAGGEATGEGAGDTGGTTSEARILTGGSADGGDNSSDTGAGPDNGPGTDSGPSADSGSGAAGGTGTGPTADSGTSTDTGTGTSSTTSAGAGAGAGTGTGSGSGTFGSGGSQSGATGISGIGTGGVGLNTPGNGTGVQGETETARRDTSDSDDNDETIRPAELDGSGDNDEISGDERNNYYRGLGGNDTLTGEGGDDTLEGGSGDDLLLGGDGADRLDGGSGNDQIFGDGGNDNIIGGTGEGDDTIDGGTGADTITYASAGTEGINYTVDGTEIDGTVYDRVALQSTDLGEADPVGTDALINVETVDLADGNDRIRNAHLADDGMRFIGNGGTDTADFSGDTAGISATTQAGGDFSVTFDGKTMALEEFESLIGGSGTDTVSYANETNALTVSGNDSGTLTVTSTAGRSDALTGFESFISGSGNDQLIGGGSADQFDGGAGDDLMRGNAGADTLNGGTGNDTLDGGSGDDYVRGGTGSDSIDGGTGYDVLDYSADGTSGGVTVNLYDGTAVSGADTDVLQNIEEVIGTSGNDVLIGGDVGDDGFEKFRGLAGNDSINGGTGNDRANSSDQFDEVDYSADAAHGGSGAVTVDLANGTAIDGFGDTDTLAGIEGVRGSAGADTLIGDDGYNRFRALAGNDVINGGAGTTDEVDHRRDVNAGGTLGVTVDLGKGFAIDGFGDTDSLSNIERARGSSFADHLIGDDGANRLRGESGNDTLDGGAGNDELQGSTGNDTLIGGAGTDLAYYGDSTTGVSVSFSSPDSAIAIADGGTDTLSGIEHVEGSNAADTFDLAAAAQDMSIDGGSGDDSVSYNGFTGTATRVDQNGIITVVLETGTETFTHLLSNVENVSGAVSQALIGTADDDNLLGTGAHDSMSGLAGDDTIDGAGGNDTLFGGAGNDTLLGASGDDTIDGEDGDDVLIGGAGDDSLTGGTGNDTVDYSGETQPVSIALSGGSGGPMTAVGLGIGTDALQSIETITTGFGDDIVDASGLTTAIVADGGAGDDTLTGGTANDSFRGGAGNDEISGGDGTDSVDYGGVSSAVSVTFTNPDTALVSSSEGDDRLVDIEVINTGSGNDAINAGAATDHLTLASNAGDDVLAGGLGNDTLDGGGGNDTLDGGQGDDVLHGDAGIDLADYSANTTDLTVSFTSAESAAAVSSLTGTDRLSSIEQISAGSGDDTFDLGAALQDLSIDGNTGTDSVSYTGFGGTATESVSGSVTTVLLDAGSETFTHLLSNIDSISGTSTSNSTLLEGTGGADVLTGTLADETLVGFGGSDTLDGAGGNDTLEGRTGNDTLLGGAGNDTLLGGDGSDTADYGSITSSLGITFSTNTTAVATSAETGTDVLSSIETINGGSGDDHINAGARTADMVLSGNGGNDTLEGGRGNDQLSGGTGNDTLDGGQGNDDLSGGDGSDTANYSANTTALNVSFSNADTAVASSSLTGTDTLTGFETILSGDGDDFIHLSNTTSGLSVSTSGGNDIILGGSGNDTLDGGSGNNTISANEGDDYVIGGGGSSLNGGDGYDVIDYSTLNVTGGLSVNLRDGSAALGADIDSVASFEEVRGTLGADELTGGGVGDDGFERFVGLAGNDTINGGDSNDLANSADQFDEVDYSRDATYTGGGASVTVDLSAGTAVDGFGDTDTLIDIEGVRGTAGGDVLTGSSGYNRFRGLAGNDVIDGGAGTSDEVDHRRDADAGGTLGVTVDFGAGTAIDGFGATDTLTNIERARGTDNADTLIGDNNDNRLRGEAGNDALDGAAGNDRVEGGAGNDTVSGGSGDDYLFGGTGNDTINGGSGYDVVDYSGQSGSLTVNLRDGTAQLGAESDTLSNIEEVIGTSGGDLLVGGSVGDEGFERFVGLAGDDTINGGDSNDLASVTDQFDEVDYSQDANYAGTGAVTVDLGAGTAVDGFGNTDTLIDIEGVRGTANGDTLTGSSGNDRFRGLAGDDVIAGGSGANDEVDHRNDVNAGGTLGVTVDLASGTAVDGFGNTDTLSNIERARGTSNADHLIGDAHDNRLRGEAGDDTLEGGAGNDRLEGGDGSNLLIGGSGTDRAEYDDISGGVTISFTSATAANAVFGTGTDSLSEIEQILGSDNDDQLDLALALQDMSIDGGSGTDTVSYTGFTGSVSDTVSGGVTTVLLTSGTDTFTHLLSNIETLTGSGTTASMSTILGTAGSDTLTGTTADEQLSGFAGDDTLDGGGGNDSLFGGLDNDTLIGGTGDDQMDGGDGFDTAYYASETSALTVSFSSANTATAISADTGTDILIDVEALSGTSAGDHFNAGAATADMVLSGNDGDDTLEGGLGNDTLEGGSGDDTLDGGQADDVMDGGTGNDVANYTANTTALTVSFTSADTATAISSLTGTDTLTGFETIDGGSGDDVIDAGLTTAGLRINGDSGNDTLDGGAGNDDLRGGSGDDTLAGSDGDDYLQGGTGSDRIGGGNGYDTVDFSEDQTTGDLTVNLRDGTATAGGNTDTLASIEDVIGTQNADVIIGGGLGDEGFERFRGLAGDDTINGGDSNDLASSSDQFDEVDYSLDANYSGGTGAVTIDLGAGTGIDGFGNTDTLVDIEGVRGTANGDTLTGSSGYNRFRALAGNDVIDGGAGTNDEVDHRRDVNAGGTLGVTVDLANGTAIDGFGNTDTLTNIERVRGTSNADHLIGDGNDNRLRGEAGDDSLDGGAGNDTLQGGDGNDVINGDAGDDTFGVENGDDTFIGGAGNDVVDYSGDTTAISISFSSADTAVAQSNGVGTDTLSGFETLSTGSGGDLIDASGATTALALSGNSGNDTFIGGSADDAFIGGQGDDKVDYSGNTDALTVSFDSGSSAVATANQSGTDSLGDIFHVVGGSGADTFVLGSAFADLSFDGGTGSDVADYSALASTVTLSENTSGATTTVTLNDSGTVYTHILSNFETISTPSSSISGTTADDVLYGTGAVDTISADSGSDVVFGDLSADTLFGEGGEDDLFGDAGNDSVSGGAGNDLIYGGAGNDIVGGGVDDDVVLGGSGDDSVSGGAGNDTLILSTGTDTLVGGAGNDVIDVWHDVGTATIADGGSSTADTLRVSRHVDLTSAEIVGSNLELNLTDADGTSATVTLQNQFGAGSDVIETLVLDDGDAGEVAFNAAASTTGSSGNDLLAGSGSADTLSGGDGRDLIFGQDGDDVLQGGAGDDILVGGAASDTFDGGDGNDIALFWEGSRTTGITVTLSGAGTGSVVGSGGGEFETLTSIEAIIGSRNDDTMTGAAGNDIFEGHYGNDTLSGGDGDDELDGSAGNDSLLGGSGDDQLYGGRGNDTLQGDLGHDVIQGGDGDDRITGTVGDELSGGDGNDVVDLSGLSESLNYMYDGFTGGEGTFSLSEGQIVIREFESIIGGSGDDSLGSSASSSDALYLDGGAGNDSLSGGAADDTFVGGAGDDHISGIDGGQDMADYSGASSGIIVDLGANGQQFIGGGQGTDQLVSITGVIGSDFADSLTGGSGDDRLRGGGGTDTINGGVGSDTVDFGDQTLGVTVTLESSGTATASGAQSDVVIDVENAIGGTGDDVLNLGSSVSGGSLFGGAGHDTLTGNTGGNYLEGGAGNDTLDGGTGSDTFLLDGQGDDRVVSANSGDRIMIGNGAVITNAQKVGSDLQLTLFHEQTQTTGTIYVENGTASGITYASLTEDNGSTSTLLMTLREDQGGVNGLDLVIVGTGSVLTGNLGTDYMVGDSNAQTIQGDGGDDTIVGGGGADILEGGDGNDAYILGDGAVTVTDSAGTADTISYMIETTTVYVDLGNNRAVHDVAADGNSGTADTLSGIEHAEGGQGDDVVRGSSSANRLDGLAGNDLLAGLAGDDTLYGDAGDDTLFGNAGNDSLYGGDGNDALFGAGGNDSLYGEDGDDSLYGGTGDDILEGGDGDDVYVFEADDGALGTNSITESSGVDTLVLSVREGEELYVTGVTAPGTGTLALDIANTDSGGTAATSGTANIQASDQNGFGIDYFQIGGRLYELGQDSSNTNTGGDGNDFIFAEGGQSVQAVNGNEGDDYLLGNANANQIDGGLGNDVILGGGGADVLDGNRGDDTVRGGEGDDEFYYFVGDGNDVFADISNTSGNDTLTLDGVEVTNAAISGEDVQLTLEDGSSLVLQGMAGSTATDTAIELLNSGGLTRSFSTSDTSATTAEVMLRGTSSIFTGSSSDDLMFGSSDVESMNGSLGSDTLFGKGGDDSLSGGTGDDTLYGGTGNDILNGGNQTGDMVSYADLDGTMGVTVNLSTTIAVDTGGAGTDTITGFYHVEGTNSADVLSGNSNSNTIIGGAGDDTLNSNGGSDVFVYEAGDGNDTITGAASGNETVLLTDTDTLVVAGASVSGATVTLDILELDDGDNTQIVLQDQSSSVNAVDQIGIVDGSGVTTVFAITDSLFGSSSNDFIYNSSGGNISGGLGDDYLVSNSSASTLDGGDGNDIISANTSITVSGTTSLTGGNGNDVFISSGNARSLAIDGGAGNDLAIWADDTGGVKVSLFDQEAVYVRGNGIAYDDVVNVESIQGGQGNDRLTGDTTNNELTGGIGDDTLNGSDGFDTLSGGSGNDTLIGGLGNDTLDGGDGNDTYIFQGLNGNVGDVIHILDTDGDDVLRLEGAAIVSHDSSTSAFTLRALNSTTGSGNGVSFGSTTDVPEEIWFEGTTYRVNSSSTTGSGGNDAIFGVASSPTSINGGDGDDYILAETALTIQGGQGNDVIVEGSPGSPGSYDGGSGDDTFLYLGTASPGASFIGGSGSDTFRAMSNAAVTVDLTAGTNSLISVTLDGIENVHGTVYNDVLTTSATSGTLVGGGGNDVLSGAAGNDTLIGGAGNDTLDGGDGEDLLIGGLGNDIINPSLKNSGSATIIGGEGTDTIDLWVTSETLVFRSQDDAVAGSANRGDVVNSFAQSSDRIEINAANFIRKSTSAGVIDNGTSVSANQFVTTSSAYDGSSVGATAELFDAGIGVFVFETGTHKLYYDANGNQQGGHTLLGDFSSTVTESNLIVNRSTQMARNGAIQLDGSNDYVAFDSSYNVGNDSQRTIEFWFHTDSNPSGTQYLLSKGNANSSTDPGFAAFLEDDRLTVQVYTNASDVASVTTTIGGGGWHHVAFTVDNVTTTANGAALELFLDGQSAGSQTYNGGDLTNSHELRLGTDAFGSNNFTGQVDDLRIWNDLRTQTEIANSRDLTISNGAENNLIASWRMDEASGQALVNAANSTISGTLTNGAFRTSQSLINVPSDGIVDGRVTSWNTTNNTEVSYSVVEGPSYANHFELDAETGEFSYQRDTSNSTDHDFFTVMVTDDGGNTDTQTIQLMLNGAGPTASATTGQGVTMGVASTIDLSATAGTAGNDLIYSLVDDGDFGTATLDADSGQLIYTANSAGTTDTLSYQITEDNGATTIAEVTLTS